MLESSNEINVFKPFHCDFCSYVWTIIHAITQNGKKKKLRAGNVLLTKFQGQIKTISCQNPCQIAIFFSPGDIFCLRGQLTHISPLTKEGKMSLIIQFTKSITLPNSTKQLAYRRLNFLYFQHMLICRVSGVRDPLQSKQNDGPPAVETLLPLSVCLHCVVVIFWYEQQMKSKTKLEMSACGHTNIKSKFQIPSQHDLV